MRGSPDAVPAPSFTQSSVLSPQHSSMAWQRAGPDQNLDLAIGDANIVGRQREGRRPARNGPIAVENATVAGAKEEAGILLPAHRAAEVRAIDGKGLELRLAVASQPHRRLRDDTGPGERRGIINGDLHRLADIELRRRANGLPLLLHLVEKW